MSNYINLIKTIKQAAVEAVETQKPAAVLFGRIYHVLEKEYHDKNKASILEAVAQKAREQNQQNKNIPKINHKYKEHSETL